MHLLFKKFPKEYDTKHLISEQIFNEILEEKLKEHFSSVPSLKNDIDKITPSLKAIKSVLIEEAAYQEDKRRKNNVPRKDELIHYYLEMDKLTQRKLQNNFKEKIEKKLKLSNSAVADIISDIVIKHYIFQLRENDRANQILNPEEEGQHLIEYLSSRYEKIDKSIIRYIWNKSLELTNPMIGEYLLMRFSLVWLQERTEHNNWIRAGAEITKLELKNFLTQDAILAYINGALFAGESYSQETMKDWNFDKTCKNLVNDVRNRFPSIKDIKPLGFDSLLNNYDPIACLEKYELFQKQEDLEEFKGMKTDDEKQPRLPVALSLPYVMYNHVNQKISITSSLVGVILSHAYEFSMRNNQATLIREFEELKHNLSEKQYFHKPCSKNDLLKQIKISIHSEIGKKISGYIEKTINLPDPIEEKIDSITTESILLDAQIQLNKFLL